MFLIYTINVYNVYEKSTDMQVSRILVTQDTFFHFCPLSPVSNKEGIMSMEGKFYHDPQMELNSEKGPSFFKFVN